MSSTTTIVVFSKVYKVCQFDPSRSSKVKGQDGTLNPIHSFLSMFYCNVSLIGSRPTQVQGVFALVPLPCGITSHYLSVQPHQLQLSANIWKRISLNWPILQHAQWPIDIMDCFMGFAVRHWLALLGILAPLEVWWIGWLNLSHFLPHLQDMPVWSIKVKGQQDKKPIHLFISVFYSSLSSILYSLQDIVSFIPHGHLRSGWLRTSDTCFFTVYSNYCTTLHSLQDTAYWKLHNISLTFQGYPRSEVTVPTGSQILVPIYMFNCNYDIILHRL